jgi:hypothetical protein
MKRSAAFCGLIILVAAFGVFSQGRRKPRTSSTATSVRPTEADGRVFLDKRIKELRVVYTLVTFKKTNGKAEEIDGSPGYMMEFEAVVRCTKPNRDPGQIVLVGNFDIACDSAGEKHTLEGVIRFEKMERGWRAIKDYPYTKVNERR